MDNNQLLIKEITRLKKERNAVILVHNYQRSEVQKIADHLGDSFALSQQAALTDAKTIVFCGVRFMAESASILSPKKTILLPEIDAECPLADTINIEDLRALKKQHPHAIVVSYINTSAEIKAESDICCTSANAVIIVNSLKGKDIIFVPDNNLGNYVAEKTNHRCILWHGNCPTHHRVSQQDLLDAKAKYPQAEVLAHPECITEVLEVSDHIFGTGGMIKYVRQSLKKHFIIVTELGLLERLERENPEKEFILPSKKLICPNMKLTTLESVYEALKNNQYVIEVPAAIADKARHALSAMLKLAK